MRDATLSGQSMTVREVKDMPMPSRPVPELAREISHQDLDRLFEGCHFPCDRKQCVNYARNQFATADTLAVLDSMPNRMYQDVGDIHQTIQHIAQQQGRNQA